MQMTSQKYEASGTQNATKQHNRIHKYYWLVIATTEHIPALPLMQAVEMPQP